MTMGMNFALHVAQRAPGIGARFERFGAGWLREGSGSGSYSGSVGKDGGQGLFTVRKRAWKGVRTKVQSLHLAISHCDTKWNLFD